MLIVNHYERMIYNQNDFGDYRNAEGSKEKYIE